MKKAIFTTSQSDLLNRNNETVTVGRTLTSDECDIEEVGIMYKVEFNDGYKMDAFEDELEFISI